MGKKYRKIILISICALQLLCSSLAKAQYTNEIQGNFTGSVPELLWYKNFPVWKNHLTGILHTDSSALQQFLEYCEPEINKDKGSFFTGFSTKVIWLDSTSQFFDNLDNKYTALYRKYVDLGSSGSTANSGRSSPSRSASRSSCNPGCTNIGFENGTLSSWSAFWAVAASTSATIKVSNITGGPCASVPQDASDPNTNTYQVSLMPQNGSDHLAGPLIPFTPPLGGRCALVGDGPIPGAGIGILEQSFTVEPSNPLLTLQYAVLLENPNHPGNEQPWFRIEVLDANGNEIPGCGQYFIASGNGLPGFVPLTNYGGGDTVYCRPWTTAFVPLNSYIGQCITVRFTASDCSRDGHYGYAYVAASCGQVRLKSTSSIFCKGQRSASITGPPGGALYSWTTTDGCINGPGTQQVLQITCAGTYKLITSSTAGISCADTFSITIPASTAGPPPVPCFSTGDTVCAGDTLHIDASCTNAQNGTKYYWDFYNNGQFEDSSASPRWSYLAAGNYNIRLHAVAPNGCSADTVMRAVVESTDAYGLPNITLSTTNATACGKCNGAISLSIALASVKVAIAITNSCNNGLISYSPSGSLRISGGGCGGLSIGGGTITNRCSNVCPGTCYYYVTPQVPIPPTRCSPTGFTGDTMAANVDVNNVNLAVSQTTVPATCGKNNGSASIAVSGGTAPYTYAWPAGLGNGTSVTGLTAGSYSITVTDSAGCNRSVTVNIKSLNSLSTIAVPHYISCYGANNGAIKIKTVGGNGPFIYNWLPNVGSTDSAGGLAPGNYSVTVTDTAGCSGTVTTQIIQPTKITDTITGNYANVPCYNTGYAVANATGGYPPYTFSWSNGVHQATDTGLTSGIYTVTITDGNQCSVSARISVGGGSGSTDTASVSIIPADTALVFCKDTSVTFTAIAINGGIAPVYQWLINGNDVGSNSNSFTGSSLHNGDVVSCILISGLVCVTGSPATSNAVKIKMTPLVSPDLMATNTIFCAGDSAQICAPDSFASYHWNTGENGNCIYAKRVGRYYVTASNNNGCIVESNHVPVSVYPVGSVSIIVKGDTLTSFGAMAYQWYVNGTPIVGATSITYVASQTGDYAVQITDGNGCKAISSGVHVTTTGLGDIADSKGLEIYPNPALSDIVIKVSSEWIGKGYELYDVYGKIVITGIAKNEISGIDISAIAKGVYFVKMNEQVRKFMKL